MKKKTNHRLLAIRKENMKWKRLIYKMLSSVHDQK